MIVDSFLFGWELDLLEMHLMEMDPFVDYFILVESEKTFQGEAKPLYYADNKERFRRWNDKIICLRPQLPEADSPWVLEHASREEIWRALDQFSDDTIVIHGDVDEIMSRNVGLNLQYIIERNKIYSLNQKLYSMAIDWLYPILWQGTVFARKGAIKHLSMLDVRNHRIWGQKISDGWHFTWLGGSEFIERKAKSFSHIEDNIQSYIKEMGSRLYSEGFHVLGEKLLPVEVDETYPEYIRLSKCPTTWYRPR